MRIDLHRSKPWAVSQPSPSGQVISYCAKSVQSFLSSILTLHLFGDEMQLSHQEFYSEKSTRFPLKLQCKFDIAIRDNCLRQSM